LSVAIPIVRLKIAVRKKRYCYEERKFFCEKSVFALLLVVSVFFCGTISFYAVDSYSLYFSQERPLQRTSTTSVNETWLEEPFVAMDFTIFGQRVDRNKY